MIDEEQRKLLGAFVRARRESIAPEAPTRRRRTPGLRRVELAARANGAKGGRPCKSLRT